MLQIQEKTNAELRETRVADNKRASTKTHFKLMAHADFWNKLPGVLVKIRSKSTFKHALLHSCICLTLYELVLAFFLFFYFFLMFCLLS